MGVFAGQATVPHHGVLVDPDQTTGLAYPAAFRDMRQDRNDLPRVESRAEKRRPFPLRESCLTGSAIQKPYVLVLAEPTTHGKVFGTPFAVIGAILILTTEAAEVIHDLSPEPYSILG